MPKSSRDLTSKERKDRLAANIAADSFDMPFKCFHCTQASVLCLVDLRSSRCVECARLGQSCNQQTTRIEYENIYRSRKKLAEELDSAEAAEDEMTKRLLDHRVRVRRLRKRLRTKEIMESQAQDREMESIVDIARFEEECSANATEATLYDAPCLDPVWITEMLSPKEVERTKTVKSALRDS